MLSGGRAGGDVDAAPLGAVIDAGSRGGVTVVCDVPRRSTAAAETALETADLVVVIAPADVRSCAAAAAIAPWVSSINPNAGVVVRGPAPGGLRSTDVAEIIGLPLLAAMRPQAAYQRCSSGAGCGCDGVHRSRPPRGGCWRWRTSTLAVNAA